MNGPSAAGGASQPIQTDWRLKSSQPAVQQTAPAGPTDPTAPVGINIGPQTFPSDLNLESRHDYHRFESYNFDQQVSFREHHDPRFEKKMLGEEMREWGENQMDNPIVAGAVGVAGAAVFGVEGGEFEVDRNIRFLGRDAEIGLRVEYDPNDRRTDPLTNQRQDLGSTGGAFLSFKIRN